MVASGAFESSPSLLLLGTAIVAPDLVETRFCSLNSRLSTILAFNPAHAVLDQPSTLLRFHKSIPWLIFHIHLTRWTPHTGSIRPKDHLDSLTLLRG